MFAKNIPLTAENPFPLLSFDNTEIAFSGKSPKDLNRSYWLFKIINNPVFVSIGKWLTLFALKIHLPIKRIIKATIFKQFVGGENIAQCVNTIELLGKFNIGTILDYSVEGSASEKDFDRCTHEIIATLDHAKNEKHIPFSVFKITGLCRYNLLEKVSAKKKISDEESKEFDRFRSRVNKICKYAYDCNIPVFIDAEESWIQAAIDDLANEMMLLYNKRRAIVFNTFQLYRKDRLSYLKQSFSMAETGNYFLGAKLVRGAYMEKERKRAHEMNYSSPIQDKKENTDTDYDAALQFCVENIGKIAVCAGTHNEKSSLYLTRLMKEKNLPNNHPHIFFSQLLGMSDHISFNLADAGYNVAKYVPYGPVKEVLPYLIRRAQENTSVKGQTGRELGLILKEKKRRKN